MKKLSLIFFIVLICISLYAETIIFSDGSTISGDLIGKKNDVVYIEYPLGNIKIPKNKIKEINDITGTITTSFFEGPDFFKSNYNKDSFRKRNRKIKTVSSILGKDDCEEIKFQLNVDNYYVKIEENDPFFVKDNSFTINLKQDKIYDLNIYKNGYKPYAQDIKAIDSPTKWINLHKDNYKRGFKNGGYLIVDSEPKSTIYIDNIKIGKTPKQIKITVGFHTLYLQKDWHEKYVNKFNIEEKEILDLGTITLLKDYGHFTVTSSPSGAEVYLDENFIGISPIKKTKILGGVYKFTAYKSKYHRKVSEVEIEAYSDIKVPIKLEPSFGKLIIKSTPTDDATIYIEDKMVGKTPYMNNEFPSSEYFVSVEKDNWLGEEKEITVEDGKTSEESFRLICNFGTIKGNALNSKLFLDNKYIGEDSVASKVRAGDYLIKAVRENYTDDSKEISIESGEEIEVTLKPSPILGSIFIRSEPFNTKGAKISIDGKKIEETTPAIIETVIGEHFITVFNPGYLPKTKQITLNKDQEKEIVFHLVPGELDEDWVVVVPSEYQMGSNEGEKDELPIHPVTVDFFYIKKYEVSQSEWKNIMGYNPSQFKGNDRPVETINFYDALEYCNKKSIEEGLQPCYENDEDNIQCDFTANGYRLPTEAEWEYAARGGIKSRSYYYSGSNKIDQVAWFAENSDNKTHKVGEKRPNEIDLYDMSGNVWEWCYDIFDKNYYSCSTQNNPKGPIEGKSRVIRGGSWDYSKSGCRCPNRGSTNPNISSSSLGFRIVRTGKEFQN